MVVVVGSMLAVAAVVVAGNGINGSGSIISRTKTAMLEAENEYKTGNAPTHRHHFQSIANDIILEILERGQEA